MAFVSTTTQSKLAANPTSMERKAQGGSPAAHALLRPDRSVRPMSGQNLHESFCPTVEDDKGEVTTLTGLTYAAYAFTANWLANLLKRKVELEDGWEESQKGSTTLGQVVWQGLEGEALTFAEWLDGFNPEPGVEYLMCRVGYAGNDNTLSDNFVQEHRYDKKDKRTYSDKVCYLFVKRDSKFLKINANGEHTLKPADGKVVHVYGEQSVWLVGTPNKPKISGHPSLPSELKGVNSMLNPELPANDKEAEAEFAGPPIPAHVFVAIFGAGFSEKDGCPDSRIFVDARERFAEAHPETETVKRTTMTVK